ncbi:transposase [Pontibacter pudoricolor]|uniref:transposase n=1 Tax=Pontibacter pudoricolor TaxID=2694930 RepID=UPI0013913827|nr:transposase [Pontibacter pudoricolor]
MKWPDRKLNRLNGFDYSRDALYFVTSCVLDKACVFGEVVNEAMQLNKFGCIAEQQWHRLAELYPYVVLHAFVVMPNHVHGIIEIDRELVGTGRDLSARRLNDGAGTVNTVIAGSLPAQKIKSLSQLVGAYKTTTSKLVRSAGLAEFAWQRSFHDHIIRSEKAYNQIRDYILSNPEKWPDDVFYQQV